MGSGKMEHWFVGKIPLDKEINNRVISFQESTPVKTGFSTFHYSTIPLFHVRGRRSDLKKSLCSQ